MEKESKSKKIFGRNWYIFLVALFLLFIVPMRVRFLAREFNATYMQAFWIYTAYLAVLGVVAFMIYLLSNKISPRIKETFFKRAIGFKLTGIVIVALSIYFFAKLV